MGFESASDCVNDAEKVGLLDGTHRCIVLFGGFG